MALLKRMAGAATLGGALMLGAGLFASPGEAGYVVTLQETGGNVVATGSGPIDLTGLSFAFSGIAESAMASGIGGIVTGVGAIDVYMGFTGPTNFGSGDLILADSGSGGLTAIDGTDDQLAVPSGYVSGDPLSDTATYLGQTFLSLGVIPGTYEWSWGTGPNQNIMLIIPGSTAVPEPASAALLGTALAGLLLAGTIRRATRGVRCPPHCSSKQRQGRIAIRM